MVTDSEEESIDFDINDFFVSFAFAFDEFSTFEEVFTMDIFKQNLLRSVAQCIGETEDA